MSDQTAWTTHRVRDLILHHASGPSPTCDERPIASSEEWGILKTTAVTWDGWNFGAHKVPPRSFWGKRDLEVRPGDVLITKAGPRDRCGVAVYVPDTPPRLMVSGKMVLLRPNKQKTNAVFLATALSTELAQRSLDARTTGMADAQLNFTNFTLLNLELPVPSLREQAAISEVVIALDTAIEQTSRLIAKYQQMKLELMYDLMSRGLSSNGMLRPTQVEAPELYKNSAVGWIPKEWTTDFLENLTSKIVDGVHHTPTYIEDGVPFVTVKNLTGSNGIDFTDLNYISGRDHGLFVMRADPKPGDVLVTKDGTLGVARIVEERYPEFSIFVSVALLRPIFSRIQSCMLYLFFESGAFEKQLGRLSAGTGLKHIHLEHFRRFIIPLPSPDEQILITQCVQEIEARIVTEEQYLDKLRAEKRGLIKDLFTRRTVVKVLKTAREAA